MITDREADAISAGQRMKTLHGTPVPDEWIGPDAIGEFDDGKGDDGDDS